MNNTQPKKRAQTNTNESTKNIANHRIAASFALGAVTAGAVGFAAHEYSVDSATRDEQPACVMTVERGSSRAEVINELDAASVNLGKLESSGEITTYTRNEDGQFAVVTDVIGQTTGLQAGSEIKRDHADPAACAAVAGRVVVNNTVS